MLFTVDMPGQDDSINEWAMRDGDWKLILTSEEQPKFLFNIAEDPYEVYNMVKKESKVLEAMMAKFAEYKESIDKDAIKASREAKKA